jgi:hypothetical protein
MGRKARAVDVMEAPQQNTKIARLITQRINDEREVLHALLVQPSFTTAETGLEPVHFIEPTNADIFKAMVGCDSMMLPRTVRRVALVLQRNSRYCARAMKKVLYTDPRIALCHFGWCCDEIRRHAKYQEKYRAAVEMIEEIENS